MATITNDFKSIVNDINYFAGYTNKILRANTLTLDLAGYFLHLIAGDNKSFLTVQNFVSRLNALEKKLNGIDIGNAESLLDRVNANTTSIIEALETIQDSMIDAVLDSATFSSGNLEMFDGSIISRNGDGEYIVTPSDPIYSMRNYVSDGKIIIGEIK